MALFAFGKKLIAFSLEPPIHQTVNLYVVSSAWKINFQFSGVGKWSPNLH